MKRFERRELDQTLIHWSMRIVKGLGLVVSATFFVFACEERGETVAPENKPDSPLETVDKILSGKGSDKPNKPSKSNGESLPAENGGEPDAPKIPVAEPVPDKPGFVISPYNGKWIDVTGVEPGTLMEDPHFKEEKKFFRVPEIPAEAAEEGEAGKGEEAAEEEQSGETEDPA